MSRQRIVVLGGGFAGLWSAVGAARKLDELGKSSDVDVVLVNRDRFHSIRVRNYERDLSGIRVPLDEVLGPVGVQRIEGEVVDVDLNRRIVRVDVSGQEQEIPYDRLVMALGSQLVRPKIPGADAFTYDVDTYMGAARLADRLDSLAKQQDIVPLSVLVVGAGLTGIETATEMRSRLREMLGASGKDRPIRVILADHNSRVGSDMGEAARPVIEEALTSLGVETRLGVSIIALDEQGAILQSGQRIEASVVVWCAGMRANPLTKHFPGEHDRFGRLACDEFLRVRNVQGVFAAGDSAWTEVDAGRPSVMSCQHARPMGRFAGHNVVADLFGEPMLPLRIDWYVTVLDLGTWGAVYTEGWDRRVVATGLTAKVTKQDINCQRIYPPYTNDRSDIFAAAEPIVQRPPLTGDLKFEQFLERPQSSLGSEIALTGLLCVTVSDRSYIAASVEGFRCGENLLVDDAGRISQQLSEILPPYVGGRCSYIEEVLIVGTIKLNESGYYLADLKSCKVRRDEVVFEIQLHP